MSQKQQRARRIRNRPTHPKPGVAFQNEEAATGNLENKAAILEHWLENGLPVQQDGPSIAERQPNDRCTYEYYPRTLRQFNLWDGQQNSAVALKDFATLKVNANDTLRRRPELRAKVVSLISSLRDAQSSELKSARREKAPEAEQLSREKSMRQRLEEELIELRRENKKLAREVEGIRSQRDAIIEESHKAIARLQGELERYKSKKDAQR